MLLMIMLRMLLLLSCEYFFASKEKARESWDARAGKKILDLVSLAFPSYLEATRLLKESERPRIDGDVAAKFSDECCPDQGDPQGSIL
jgi:hypothetical protein